ncbi:hypothetical protein L7F22_025477 [Adiantum nelumboides]|nr:hypothetical protein [Adiantum nelumboides]
MRPATFQRFVTHVFQPFFGKSIRVFIDDFCIYSSRVLHLGKVNEGLARLQSLGGQLNVDKCHIAESQVTLLGHVVSSRGIEADPGKVQALVSLPSPKSARELVSFIQKVRYLSRFIHLLSQVVLPLQQLTHNNTFNWSEENEQQFNEIKELLSSLPTIAPPRWEETFYVNPSVGSDSIGAVLMQKDGETSFMRPIYFVSRVMTPLEKDYTVIEQMVMALMFAVGRFRSYLLPKKFVILTVEDTFPLVLQHMDVSTRISKWKVKVKAPGPEPVEVQAKLSGAHSLYFDGAYKQKVDKASVGISIQDENGQKVFGKGLLVENTHSNNEAEYAALALGLEWCVSMGIKRLNVFGDALLLIKQVHGTWACRNQSLVPRLRRVKELMKRFEAIQLYHVPRKGNQEADALASEQLQEVIVGAIKLQNPLFQGSDCMHDIVNFLETGECPQDMSKGQRQWLVRKATKYRLINEHLYCKGKDLVLRRVPHSKDIKQVLTSCHEGVCGGHFAHDITSRSCKTKPCSEGGADEVEHTAEEVASKDDDGMDDVAEGILHHVDSAKDQLHHVRQLARGRIEKPDAAAQRLQQQLLGGARWHFHVDLTLHHYCHLGVINDGADVHVHVQGGSRAAGHCHQRRHHHHYYKQYRHSPP